MSFFSMPRGIYRTNAVEDTQGFIPETIIDVLFDYAGFLNTSDDSSSGSIATSGPSSVKKIAIVGAGAAGLVAAYELSKIENIDVTLYEASDRLGGRMDSTVIPDGSLNSKIFEMGCMRFPPTSYTLYHYLKKFGLDSEVVPNFPDPGVVDTELLYENQVIEWPAGSATPNNADFQRIGIDFGNMLTFILGSANEPDITNPSKLFDFWAIYQNNPSADTKQSVINSWQSIINQYNSTTYYDAVFELGQNTAVVIQPWTQEDMNKFGALGVGSGGFGPLYGVNFVEILRLFANGWEDNQELLLTGIISLVEAFNEAIANKVTIKMNSKVTQISKVGNNQYSMLINVVGGSSSSENYDSVIVATTTRAMEYMGLTVDGIKNSNGALEGPAALLKQAPKEAIRNLHLMNSSKYFVTTTSKFWYAANNSTGADLPFNMQTDELMRGLYCLNYDPDLAENEPNTQGKGVVLISYVWGDDSSKLLALTEDERYQQFLLAIKGINPTFAELLEQQTEKIQIIDWENTSNYYGAFKLNYPGQEQDNHGAFFQYQEQKQGQGLILAGDSVSWAGGWLEGAMPTGVNAACAAASFVGATIAASSPLTDIPSDMYVYDNPPEVESCFLQQDAYLSAASNGNYSFGANDFSLAAWIKPTGAGTIIGKKSTSGGAQNGGFLLVVQDSGAIKFATDNGLTFGQIMSDKTEVFDGNWHLVVAVRSGANLNIYLDGELLQGTTSGSVSSPLDVTNNLDVLIGAVQQEQEPFIHYSGNLCNVKMWSRAVTQTEIQDGSITGLYGSEDNLVAYWPLQKDGEDLSSTQNDAIATGDVIYNFSQVNLVSKSPIFDNGNLLSKSLKKDPKSKKVTQGQGPSDDEDLAIEAEGCD